jgi:hypothetical protein
MTDTRAKWEQFIQDNEDKAQTDPAIAKQIKKTKRLLQLSTDEEQ